MLLDVVLKKTSALLAAMLTMTAAWSLLHLPGANLQRVAFAFLSSAALCTVSVFRTRMRYCIFMICGAAGNGSDVPVRSGCRSVWKTTVR